MTPGQTIYAALVAQKKALGGAWIPADAVAIIDKEISELVASMAGESKPKRVRQTLGVGIPPHPDDVTAYSASIGYPLDGHKWCDHYAQKGWIVSGRAIMKDAKAAIRNWKANGWGQEGGIALRKLPPKAPDIRYVEPVGDWRATARRWLKIEELPEGWITWADVPLEHRTAIHKIHLP